MKLHIGTISRLLNLRNKYGKLNTTEMPREERRGEKRRAGRKEIVGGKIMIQSLYTDIL